ncbi:nucleotidyltransferase domain-containing protein [Nonomuraea sp. NPDC050404]|uniref:nucleotidyltransferase domain-containing protein n=1 Tax=Nonomuraea sp. NPDC050404 TaxID=3155783 RepID=UPI0033C76212
MSTESSLAPPAPRLARLRSRWLAAATAGLGDDPGVAGAALLGSLGTGRFDDWSDIDLLVVVDDARLDDYAAPAALPAVPGTLTAVFDARQNGPRGTRALSLNYVVDGLPLWVDWHVHPVSRAGWAADSEVILDRHGFDRFPATFAELHGGGEPEPPIPASPVERRPALLGMIPIAAKRIARRSPDTPRMVTLVGGPDAPGASWAEQVATLRRLLGEYASFGPPAYVAAAHAHLDLVEQTFS